jgi:putative NIF3 family GTP cyclohydrolase 1 type 2
LYSSDGFYSDPTLKRAEINKIVDELVSPTERGEKVKGKDMILQSGSGMSMNTEYENVSIVIYSDASQHQGQTVARDTVATITWKHRICQ